MNEWADIATLTTNGRTLEKAPCAMVDLYSAKSNIRWPDCRWSERDECWFSMTRYINKSGYRMTQYRPVVAPTHWLVPTPMPYARATEAAA